MLNNIYIGTSGWHYDDWRGRFYPEKMPKTKWLEFYARHFNTLELNNSFYRLPSEKAFITWHDSSPPGFIFAVKASRYITHIKRLKDCEEAVEKFILRVSLLKDKLGPVLYQLPASFQRDHDRLDSFLSILPRGFRHVIEFRHKSWFDEDVYDILRRNNTGFCVFDMPKLTSPLIATSGFAYIRFHGSGGLYSGRYGDEDLAEWAKKIKRLAANVGPVNIYFNNDVRGYAIDNARTLRNYLEE
jgi:uncharacterized protein YecE (DUF72 family)